MEDMPAAKACCSPRPKTAGLACNARGYSTAFLHLTCHDQAHLQQGPPKGNRAGLHPCRTLRVWTAPQGQRRAEVVPWKTTAISRDRNTSKTFCSTHDANIYASHPGGESVATAHVMYSYVHSTTALLTCCILPLPTRHEPSRQDPESRHRSCQVVHLRCPFPLCGMRLRSPKQRTALSKLDSFLAFF